MASLVAAPGAGQRPSRGTSHVDGQVRFAKTNAAAENVLVQIESSIGGVADQVRTDHTGKFSFRNLDATSYLVIVKFPGYRLAQQRVNLQTTDHEYVMLELTPETNATALVSAVNSLTRNSKISDSASVEYEKARTILSADAKKTSEAITHLQKAVSLDPEFTEAQFLLGTSYMDLRQWDKAEKSLANVVKVNPNGAPAMLALGEVYLQTQKYKQAEELLSKGLALDDKAWRGHLTLGRVYFATGELAKAGPEVARTIQLKPDVAEAHLLAGNILFKARQADKALPLFEEYLKLDPNGPYAAETRELVAKIKKALGIQ